MGKFRIKSLIFADKSALPPRKEIEWQIEEVVHVLED